jgi:hypothetical protein
MCDVDVGVHPDLVHGPGAPPEHRRVTWLVLSRYLHCLAQQIISLRGQIIPGDPAILQPNPYIVGFTMLDQPCKLRFT